MQKNIQIHKIYDRLYKNMYKYTYIQIYKYIHKNTQIYSQNTCQIINIQIYTQNMQIYKYTNILK